MLRIVPEGRLVKAIQTLMSRPSVARFSHIKDIGPGACFGRLLFSSRGINYSFIPLGDFFMATPPLASKRLQSSLDRVPTQVSVNNVVRGDAPGYFALDLIVLLNIKFQLL
jgi:hypothetical protein